MDLFFLLDSSSSIWKPDYIKMLNFVTDIINDLDIGPTRVGALTFSDDVNFPVVSLSDSPKSDLKSSISMEKLPYKAGLTGTDSAITFVREQNFRRDASRVMVLMTDGVSTKPEETRRQAELAKEEGFKIYVIGVGMHQDKKEWSVVASDPDSKFVFERENFDSLSLLKEDLLPEVCGHDSSTRGQGSVTRGNRGPSTTAPDYSTKAPDSSTRDGVTDAVKPDTKTTAPPADLA